MPLVRPVWVTDLKVVLGLMFPPVPVASTSLYFPAVQAVDRLMTKSVPLKSAEAF